MPPRVRLARLRNELAVQSGGRTLHVTQPLDRITHRPDILAGRATVRGLRVSVAHIVNLVANGMSAGEIIADLPDLDEEDIHQALAYAAALAKDELHPLRA